MDSAYFPFRPESTSTDAAAATPMSRSASRALKMLEGET